MIFYLIVFAGIAWYFISRNPNSKQRVTDFLNNIKNLNFSSTQTPKQDVSITPEASDQAISPSLPWLFISGLITYIVASHLANLWELHSIGDLLDRYIQELMALTDADAKLTEQVCWLLGGLYFGVHLIFCVMSILLSSVKMLFRRMNA